MILEPFQVSQLGLLLGLTAIWFALAALQIYLAFSFGFSDRARKIRARHEALTAYAVAVVAMLIGLLLAVLVAVNLISPTVEIALGILAFFGLGFLTGVVLWMISLFLQRLHLRTGYRVGMIRIALTGGLSNEEINKLLIPIVLAKGWRLLDSSGWGFNFVVKSSFQLRRMMGPQLIAVRLVQVARGHAASIGLSQIGEGRYKINLDSGQQTVIEMMIDEADSLWTDTGESRRRDETAHNLIQSIKNSPLAGYTAAIHYEIAKEPHYYHGTTPSEWIPYPRLNDLIEASPVKR